MENRLFELVVARRSIREYSDETIERNVLNKIMKVALTAPCSFGHRPVGFIVVQNPERIQALAACKSLGGTQIIGAVIVVMVKLDCGELWIEDGTVASSYILLATEQYGIGACWVQIRNRTGKEKTSDEEVRELLGVPDGYAILNLVALGGKGENRQGYAESDFDADKIHYETYC